MILFQYRNPLKRLPVHETFSYGIHVLLDGLSPIRKSVSKYCLALRPAPDHKHALIVSRQTNDLAASAIMVCYFSPIAKEIPNVLAGSSSSKRKAKA